MRKMILEVTFPKAGTDSQLESDTAEYSVPCYIVYPAGASWSLSAKHLQELTNFRSFLYSKYSGNENYTCFAAGDTRYYRYR